MSLAMTNANTFDLRRIGTTHQIHRRLMIAGVTSLAAATCLLETQCLLANAAALTASMSGDGINPATSQAQFEVENMIAELQQLAELTPCADAAAAYLSTASNLDLAGAGSLTLEISGISGQQQFTFFSGTTQANIIAAINTFTEETSVTTKQCLQNKDRVEFRSTILGSLGWLRVKQINFPKYNYNLLSDTPNGIVITSDLYDEGTDGLQGDATCDWIVNPADLSLVIRSWGDCPESIEPCFADLTGNGFVDVDDLLSVINNWTQFD